MDAPIGQLILEQGRADLMARTGGRVEREQKGIHPGCVALKALRHLVTRVEDRRRRFVEENVRRCCELEA